MSTKNVNLQKVLVVHINRASKEFVLQGSRGVIFHNWGRKLRTDFYPPKTSHLKSTLYFFFLHDSIDNFANPFAMVEMKLVTH